MANTLEIFLRSRFDASGADNAMRAFKAIGVSGEKLNDIFNKQGALQFMTGLSKNSALTVESMEQLKKVVDDAKKKFAQIGDLEGFLAMQKISQSLSGAINKLSADTGQLTRQMKEAQTEASALTARFQSMGAVMRGEATSAINQFVNQMGDARKSFKEMQSAGMEIDLKDFAQFADPQTIKARLKSLDFLHDGAIKAARGAITLGGAESIAGMQALQAADKIMVEIRALERLIPATDRATRELERQGKSTKTAGGIMDWFIHNPLNKLGFAMFITTQTIRTMTTALSNLLGSFEKGAALSDRFNAFNKLLTDTGINATTVKNKLIDAGQGAVSMDMSMKKTIQLMKAGFPEVAADSDKLLRIATNAAIVSGELDQVEVIYDKLIRGIIRGSPRLIDDADIILKLGDANERYAASIGKTVEQLSAHEKALATNLAVMREGERINQMAESMDSASLMWRQMRVATKEAADMVSMVWAEAAGIGAESVKEITTELKDYILAIAQASGASEDFGKDMELLFGKPARMVGIFSTMVVGGVATIMHAAGELLKPFSLLTQSILLSIQAAGTFWDVMTGGDPAEALERAKEIGAELADVDAELVGLIFNSKSFGEIAVESFQAGVDKAHEFGTAIGIIEQPISSSILLLNRMKSIVVDIFDSPSRLFGQFGGIVDQALADMKGDSPESESRSKALASQEQFEENIADIRQDWADKVVQISQDSNAKLIKIAQDRDTTLERLAEDHVQKMLDIDTDLSDKMSDIAVDADDKRADARQDTTRKLEEIEEDHQRKIDDIMRKFEMSRLQAIIDRDARALFEAENRKNMELQGLEQDTNQRNQDEVDNLQDKLDKIAIAEERAMRDANKRADRARRDAEIAADRRRDDAIKAADQRMQDEIKAAQLSREKAKESRDKLIEEEVESAGERALAIGNWYQEQLRKQKIENLATEMEQLRSLGMQEGQLGEALGRMLTLHQTYVNDLNGLTGTVNTYPDPGGTGGTGSTTPPPPTTPPGGTDNTIDPATIVAGGSCSVNDGRGHMGSDGQIYICWYGTWTLAASTTGGVTSGMSIVGGDGQNPYSSPQSGGTQTVNIEVHGDKTLAQIFKEMAYEAIIEVIG